jgi:hypothetical protein
MLPKRPRRPCPPETLTEMKFSPATVAGANTKPPALGVKRPNLGGRQGIAGRHRALPLLERLERPAEP